ncbi:zinc finger BED domain-containing protein 4-like [Diabrotica virgifera virgifera]|uniref:BED-type domain-containing protein n=1 Tax=Diabrotica virgifera virgifera TaxID=50390 RepID=A0ABM5K7D9_DIAVI|nr:zinc finger BED domain-containing protein 4-like [Diabrotica virgifera virgifera]
MPKKSAVWLHFDKSADGKSAKCKHCGKLIKSSGNTSNLRGHVESMHKKYVIETSKPGSEEPQPSEPSKKQKLDNNFSVSSQADAGHAGPSTSTQMEFVNPSSAIQIMRQPSIVNTIRRIESYKDGGRQNEKITQSILYMICKDMVPFRVVERVGFKKLMKDALPHYVLPSRFTLKRQVKSKYDVVSSSMRTWLSNKKVTLTTDVWTDLQMRSFSSLTVHFVDEENQLFSGTVGMIPLEDRHTSEYLCEQLRSLCSEWEIQEQNIVAIVTDNGPNIVKAINLFVGSKRHLPCYAHTLNLVCQNSLQNCPELVELLDKVKKIVSWFKQSVVASDELRSASPNKKVIQSVPTRWNSTFNMIERFLELRPIINEIINRHSSAPIMVTAAEVEILSEMCNILEPLYTATNEISGETYLTSSLCIPITSITRKRLEAVTVDKKLTQKLKGEVLKEFDRRFGSIEQFTLLGLATLLDPRFKKMYFKNALACSKYINMVNARLRSLENESDEPTISDTNETDSTVERSRSIFSDHNKQIQAKWKETNKEGTLQRDLHPELSLYLSAPAAKIEENPITIWVDMKGTYPKLSGVVAEFVPLVGTSVPSERLFSKAGQIITKTRNRLEGKLASNLLFLNSLPEKMW